MSRILTSFYLAIHTFATDNTRVTQKTLAMKRNIGNTLALYPTPAVVVGAVVNGKASWTLVAHIGIVAHDRLLVSLHSSHYINSGIKESRQLSVNIVTEEWLPKADYCGIVSGRKTDKSGLFDCVMSEEGTPLVGESPLTMACRVEDVYVCNGFENFICSIVHTYADESVLDASGKLDYNRLKPVLFEFPTYQYLRTGSVIAHCTDAGKMYEKNQR